MMKTFLILFIKLSLIVQFVSLNQSNETHFIATNEWQEIKPGKIMTKIHEKFHHLKKLSIFRTKSATRTSLSYKYSKWL